MTNKSEIKYKQNRLENLINYYPHNFTNTITIPEYIEKYSNIENNSRFNDQVFNISGRVYEIRKSSKKLAFIKIKNDGCYLQLIMHETEFLDNFSENLKQVHRGDIIGVIGFAGKSKKGELSINVTKIVILTPCLKFLPKTHFGITDSEICARKRYLDLIVNDNTRNIFIIRNKIFREVEKYLDNMGFLKIQTPILASQAGGANAKPFITYHNDLKQNMYLRVAPELYLKQLVVGGFNKIYEIGPQFRNESCDKTHNPEFYSVEFYMAYSDYFELITITEELFPIIVKAVGYDNLICNGIDFTPPYTQFDIKTELEKQGIKFDGDLFSDEYRQYLDKECQQRSIQCFPPRTTSRLFDKLIGHYIEPKCINPSFIMNHPLIMSPLSKSHRNNPMLAERFELFVNGFELVNAYTELNMPDIQRHYFEKQMQAKNEGDEEAQNIDETYIDALEYGLPPTAGWGCGLDRLVMLLTNKNNIQDVIPFPVLAEI